MRRFRLLFILLPLAALLTAFYLIPEPTPPLSSLREGDIVFQASMSNQSKAIQLATGSVWSHCGVVMRGSKGLEVWEAVQPVKHTPLATWVSKGRDKAFVARRLHNADQVLTDSVLKAMKAQLRTWEGRNYDLYFEWTDQSLYCSELVWKLYHNTTGQDIGTLKPLGSYDLSHPVVRAKLEERFGPNIPLETDMISPQEILISPLLERVK